MESNQQLLCSPLLIPTALQVSPLMGQIQDPVDMSPLIRDSPLELETIVHQVVAVFQVFILLLKILILSLLYRK